MFETLQKKEGLRQNEAPLTQQNGKPLINA